MLTYHGKGVTFSYRPRLKISEKFLSVQGEGRHVGLPCCFIRLTGCALRCTYCDTAYAFYGGAWQPFEELLDFVAGHRAELVQITGGEPLHQPAVWPFVDLLVERGFQPLIETGGAVSIQGLNASAHIVLDIKTPGSGELNRMLWSNLDLLKPSDEVKFVVTSLADLQWCFDKIRELELEGRFEILISPVAESQEKAAFAEALLTSGIKARFQIQLHKILWGGMAGR